MSYYPGMEMADLDDERDSVSVALDLVGATDMAIQFTDGADSFWIPKSQIQNMTALGKGTESFMVTIPEWLALDKELI